MLTSLVGKFREGFEDIAANVDSLERKISTKICKNAVEEVEIDGEFDDCSQLTSAITRIRTHQEQDLPPPLGQQAHGAANNMRLHNSTAPMEVALLVVAAARSDHATYFLRPMHFVVHAFSRLVVIGLTSCSGLALKASFNF